MSEMWCLFQGLSHHGWSLGIIKCFRVEIQDREPLHFFFKAHGPCVVPQQPHSKLVGNLTPGVHYGGDFEVFQFRG